MVLLPKQIDVQSFQHDQALATFLSYCLPDKASEEVPLSWLYSVAAMTKETEAIRLAASALSYGWIGHVEERSEIVSDGLRFYSGALQRLRRIVGHDDPISQRSETLATMELLTLYEVS